MKEQDSQPQPTSNRRRRHEPTDLSWIPESTGERNRYFPWLLKSSGNPGRAVANPKYLNRVDDAQAVRVFGEWNPQTDLSVDAKRYLGDLQYVFRQLARSAEPPQEFPLVGGMPFEEFKATIAETIEDRREFRYIMNQIDVMFSNLEREWKEAMTRPVELPIQRSEPWVDPRVAQREKIFSAGYAIQLASREINIVPDITPSPPSLSDLPLPDITTRVSLPMPSPDISTKVELPPPQAEQPAPAFQEKLRQAPTQAPVDGYTKTDAMRDELIEQKLVDPTEKLKPVVIVTMRNIRDAMNDPTNHKDPYEMVNVMRLDPGIDDDDLRKLTLFTDNLLSQGK